ncbi:MAG: hypothetical protein WCL51_12850 [Bacteroidota bacterium]
MKIGFADVESGKVFVKTRDFFTGSDEVFLKRGYFFVGSDEVFTNCSNLFFEIGLGLVVDGIFFI